MKTRTRTAGITITIAAAAAAMSLTGVASADDTTSGTSTGIETEVSPTSATPEELAAVYQSYQDCAALGYGCIILDDVDTGTGAHLIVFGQGEAPSRQQLTVFTVAQQGVIGMWRTPDNEGGHYDGLTCASGACVLKYSVGAHSARAVELHPDGVTGGYTSITDGGQIASDTPDIFAIDLDGDGDLDLAAKNSTWDPSYATAPQFFTTYRNDAGVLTATGCSVPSADRAQPAPTELQTGSCAA